jgi:tripartite-type tricarboxylate transporter receptor subunit TctC
MNPTRRSALLAGAALLAASTANAKPSPYPSRAIHLIVPFPAGGPTDVVARITAAGISQRLGAPFVVENLGGASGILGTVKVSKAIADAYTLGVATVSTHGTIPLVQPDVAYNPITDFTPIYNLASSPTMLAVHPSFPASDLKSFIRVIQMNPNRYDYASAGAGGINDLSMAWFLASIEGRMQSIAYKGSSSALLDVVAGHVPVIYDNLPSTIGYVLSGKLRGLAISGVARSKIAPGLPTFAELGFDDHDGTAWYGLVGPARLPLERIARLAQAAAATLKDPLVISKLNEVGAEPLSSSPAAFAQHIERERTKWAKILAKTAPKAK